MRKVEYCLNQMNEIQILLMLGVCLFLQMEWANDANAERYIPNDFGSDNCLVSTVTA